LFRHTDLAAMLRQMLDTSLELFEAEAGSLLMHQQRSTPWFFVMWSGR
jgi:hypothetical protein